MSNLLQVGPHHLVEVAHRPVALLRQEYDQARGVLPHEDLVGLGPVGGTRYSFANRAKAARLRKPVSSNVRRHTHGRRTG